MVWFGDFHEIEDKKVVKDLLKSELNAKGIRFRKNTVKFKLRNSDVLLTNESKLLSSFQEMGLVFKGFY